MAKFNKSAEDSDQVVILLALFQIRHGKKLSDVVVTYNQPLSPSEQIVSESGIISIKPIIEQSFENTVKNFEILDFNLFTDVEA